MTRVNKILNGFKKTFKSSTSKLVECGGRIEILGNHTDHNHGLCLVAGCDLTILSAVKERDDNIINILSKGMKIFKVDLKDLSPMPQELGTSKGLVRGVAAYFKEHDLNIGGFDAYMESNIFQGAGVSSSAAFECLIGEIFNSLFNEGKIDKLTIAKAGQYSENKYFGKNSGLLDQIGTAFGGISFLDFKDVDNPVVTPLTGDYTKLHFVLVNTGGSHASLSDMYSSIPNDMLHAANILGTTHLRYETLETLEKYKDKLSEMEYLRSKHFYLENERVLIARDAINHEDFETFFKMVRASQESSKNYLKNTMILDHYEGSPQEAVDYASTLLKKGAARINGGGFAGTIICFVTDEEFDFFMNNMIKKYGEANVHEVKINHDGAKSFRA